MRVLVVDTYYPAFLKQHYAERPELREATYAEQLAALMGRSFGTSDAYSVNLIAHGHDAADVIVNAEELQLRWAEENGYARLARLVRRVPQGRARAAAFQVVGRRIAAAQIRRYRPDIVYIQDMHVPRAAELAWLGRRGYRLVGQTASGFPREAALKRYDLVLTSFPHYVERIRRLGVASEYFAIAFDDRVLSRVQGVRDFADRPYRCSFVGALASPGHGRGTALLERLCAEVDVDTWGYGVDLLPSGSSIRRRYHGEAWGLDMYGVLGQSRIVVNRHIDMAEGHANNMRLFEATGIGALLFTENAPNLGDLFDPDREVVTYDGVSDLVDKARHYDAAPREAAAIAAAGQARTLAQHTYAVRIRELADILTTRFA